MTTLLIQTEGIPLTVNLPAIATLSREQFYEFCQANRDLRIERTATGEVIIMPPVFSDTGNRNLKISQQLANWADQDGTGECFDSSAGFTYRMEQRDRLMLPGLRAIAGMHSRKSKKLHLRLFALILS